MQKLYPSDAEIIRNQAKIYESIGDLDNAESLYKKLIELNKLDTHPYTRLGAIYEEKGDTSRAKDFFETSIQLGTEDPLPFVRLAHIYIKMGVMDKGLRFIKIGFEEIIRYMGPIQRSLVGSEIKGLDKMRELGEKAKEAKSKESLLREILEILTENYSDKVVEDELTVLLKRFPNSPVLLEWFADFYERRGDFETASSFLEKLLKIRPDSKGAHISRGNILLAKGDTTGAIISYRRAIELGAEDDSIYLTLISIYRNRGELDTLRKMWKMDLRRKHSDKLSYYLEQISEKEPSHIEVH